MINYDKLAFPCKPKYSENGMTLLDYFAAKAMQGMLSCPASNISMIDDEKLPKSAYEIAYAMIKTQALDHELEDNFKEENYKLRETLKLVSSAISQLLELQDPTKEHIDDWCKKGSKIINKSLENN